jgi:hypothetical protein
MQALKDFGQATNHGVEEDVTCTCEVCGHKKVMKMIFEPADFFPKILD